MGKAKLKQKLKALKKEASKLKKAKQAAKKNAESACKKCSAAKTKLKKAKANKKKNDKVIAKLESLIKGGAVKKNKLAEPSEEVTAKSKKDDAIKLVAEEKEIAKPVAKPSSAKQSQASAEKPSMPKAPRNTSTRETSPSPSVKSVKPSSAVTAAKAKPSASTRTRRAAPEAATKASTRGAKQDDLKLVEGIGPKIEQLLQAANIKTWAQLARASQTRLKKILTDAGRRYQAHDPGTWPEQAALARDKKFKELEALKKILHKGKRV